MIELETLKKKIIYRANYRGTKEMDILLSKFVDKYINTFSKDELEHLFDFLNMEDTILYSSCFDANGGLFETLLGPNDAIISDALNHASIIDGVRLCKAQRKRYSHSNMDELESILQDTQTCDNRLITTDGVFSMDGDVAKLEKI